MVVSLKDPTVGLCVSVTMPSGSQDLHRRLDGFFCQDVESLKNVNTCRLQPRDGIVSEARLPQFAL